MKKFQIVPILMVLFTVPLAAQSQSITMHITEVRMLQKGFEVEARSGNILYYMTCKQDDCTFPKVGQDYHGSLTSAPLGTGLAAFVADAAPRVPGTSGYVIPYFIERETEITGCEVGAK